MRILTNSKYILMSVAIYFGYLVSHQPTVIQGKLIWENSTTPAANVFVYITDGVEEDLTDKDGNFSIRTWKKLPTELVIKYKDHQPFRVSINDGNKKHTIWLKK